MAWTDITNFVAFKTFLTTTLGGYIKDNFAYLYQNTSAAVFNIPLWKVSNEPAGGAVTNYAIPLEGIGLTAQYYIIRDVATGGADEYLIQNYYVYIPENASTITIYSKGDSEIQGVTLVLNFYLGAATASYGNFAAPTAFSVDIDVSGIAGTVVEFKVSGTNNTGTTRWIQMIDYCIGVVTA